MPLFLLYLLSSFYLVFLFLSVRMRHCCVWCDGGECGLEAAGFHEEDEHHEDEKPSEATQASRLSSALVGIGDLSGVVWVIVIEPTMGDEDLPWPAIVVGADDVSRFKLADEFGGALVADVETVAQHHRCDGSAAPQELYRLVVERVGIGERWRQHRHILGGDIDSGGGA